MDSEKSKAKAKAENNEPTKESDDRTLGVRSAVRRFVSKLEGIKTSEEIVMPLINVYSDDVEKKFNSFVEDNDLKAKEEEEKISYSIPITLYGRFEKLQKRQNAIHSAARQTPRALFVALVSTYDAFLGELLREIFYIKPELLNASNRTFTFPELVALDSISSAREYLIDKEVESVLRDSHEKHFAWMESRFDIVLRKGLDSWPNFIELTERRNLFVHADGVVSAQYISVCESQKVPLKGIKSGARLDIEPEYFEQAFECLFQIGVKLSQVLSRKFCPDELDKADSLLNDISFELLKAEKYRLAANLLEFSLSTLKKHHSALNRRLFVVNLAIAYKMGNLGPDSTEHLEKEDWSDCAPHFKLAKAVLTDRFKEAETLMLSLGKKAPGINRFGYETWPLFKEFRKSTEFRSAFEKIYGEKFTIPAPEIESSELSPKKAPAKKAPAKKAPAKKTPAKKAPANKAPANKAPTKKAASAKKASNLQD